MITIVGNSTHIVIVVTIITETATTMIKLINTTGKTTVIMTVIPVEATEQGVGDMLTNSPKRSLKLPNKRMPSKVKIHKKRILETKVRH